MMVIYTIKITGFYSHISLDFSSGNTPIIIVTLSSAICGYVLHGSKGWYNLVLNSDIFTPQSRTDYVMQSKETSI